MSNPNDSRISALPAHSALTGSENFVIVQSGTTKRVDLDSITQKVLNYIETNGIGSFSVAGEVTAQKLISTISGVQFPDGTVMTTAAGVSTGMTSTGSLTFASNTDATGIGDTIFSTNTVERMRITTVAGNVGIGYANPLNTLHVKSVVRLSSNETASTNKTGAILGSQYDSVGEPEGFLAYFMDANIAENIAWIGGGIAAYNAATNIRFYTSTNNSTRTGIERMRIIENGNVGIGAINPLDRLHVIGKIRVSDNETPSTNKSGRMIFSQYDSVGEPEGVGALALDTSSTENVVRLGGGAPSFNAATAIRSYTAANTITREGTLQTEIKSDGGIFMYNLKSGTTQGGAGASANELWVDTDDDNTIKRGV